ncbi:YihY/virulence factor BrkB family protein [Fructilactobacillus cliffordii]|uniref:YihY/virulence factor BrkB family protein n=1 Tax=Fructilactobacillus cliffordii TaxID=2940299 RepID=A0A9Q8ZVS7_9LACO|nr:YihY/virulence factor BrkB family protein [Fructilactobacillus cliffordii]USS86361.1 YihY/virulence factor BrkB family protein [Fructilactobacillus cliffordii]USS89426.1 YihY/virulence factor BrkB family protein [Fructilactobacillus cliffordii]
MPTRKQRVIQFLKILLKRYTLGNVSDSAVVFAYYVLFSLFPILIIVGGIIRLTNSNVNHVLALLHSAVPDSIYQGIAPIAKSIFTGDGGSILSIGIIIVIWSASSSMAAFQRTINRIYGVTEQSTLMNRLTSFIWMLLLVVLLFVLIVLMGFGRLLLNFAHHDLHVPISIINLLNDARLPVTLGISIVILTLLYYFVPSVETKLKYTVWGAIVALIGLLALTQVFSLIISAFFHNISAYKTLGTVMVLMLWLNFTGTILLFGAVVNASLQEYFGGSLPESVAQTSLKALYEKSPHRSRRGK